MRIVKLIFLLVIVFLVIPIEYNAKDKVKVILFEGNGCEHCEAAIGFFDSIEDEYGQYFEVIDYEVFDNAKNKRLQNKVASYFNENATGVPYIIIGEATFYGYKEDFNDDIIKAIMNEYNNDNRIDVIKEATKIRLEHIILVGFLIGIGGLVTFLCYGKK